jgi:CRP-like cAMP-binding protein
MNHAFIEQRQKYRATITQRFGITPEMYDTVTQLVAPLMVAVNLRKGEFLQRSGVPAQYLYWMHSGVVRNGFITENGTEVTLRFTTDGDSAGSHDDLLAARGGIPARHFIVAETAVAGFRIDWSDMTRLVEENEVMRYYYLKASEYSILRDGRRLCSQSNASARERLNAFRLEYPGLESRISQKVIASFLGITPQYMSQLLRQDGEAKA